MLENLDTVAWSALAQPEWNVPDEVPRSLRALAASDSLQTADTAYQRVLYAIGNNHAGTYYPVVLPVLAFLGEILREGSDWSRVATLDVLIDLLTSFAPEPGHELVRSPEGDDRDLRVLVFREAAALETCIRPLADTGDSQRVRELAGELLAILADGPSPTTDGLHE